jgi:20S proteasome alpha/beta subunit
MRRKQPMTLDEAKMLMRDAFRAVCERESTTGDSIKLVSVSAKDKEV